MGTAEGSGLIAPAFQDGERGAGGALPRSTVRDAAGWWRELASRLAQSQISRRRRRSKETAPRQDTRCDSRLTFGRFLHKGCVNDECLGIHSRMPASWDRVGSEEFVGLLQKACTLHMIWDAIMRGIGGITDRWNQITDLAAAAGLEYSFPGFDTVRAHVAGEVRRDAWGPPDGVSPRKTLSQQKMGARTMPDPGDLPPWISRLPAGQLKTILELNYWKPRGTPIEVPGEQRLTEVGKQLVTAIIDNGRLSANLAEAAVALPQETLVTHA